MPTDQAYTISELATLAGVTPRTIRYYLSIGLLPSPGQGPGTRYGDGHLARLRLTRRLQREHLPLGEISVRLEGLDDAAVDAALAADETDPSGSSSGPAPGSALQYIHRLKEAQQEAQRGAPGAPDARGAPPSRALRSLAPSPAHAAAAPLHEAITASPEPEPAAGTQRTQWERVTLSPNVELHIRRPSSRAEQKQVERLVRLGRELLEGGQPT